MGIAALKANLIQQLTAMREAVLFKIFLDLQKAYDALYWYRCLDIIAVYGVRIKMLRLLRTYWYQLTMVARAGGYFGRLFKGYQVVTQGDHLSTTIFNVFVDAVIRHWVMVVTPTEAGTGGIGLTIIDLAAYFYANDVLVVSTQPERLQRASGILTSLFAGSAYR